MAASSTLAASDSEDSNNRSSSNNLRGFQIDRPFYGRTDPKAFPLMK